MSDKKITQQQATDALSLISLALDQHPYNSPANDDPDPIGVLYDFIQQTGGKS